MDFGALPPEVNAARLYSGPGSGPMLVAAGAWGGLVDGLYSAATSFETVIAGLADDSWQGPAATLMVAAAAPYLKWMVAAAAQAQQAATQARSAATAYETALAMTASPPVIAANRERLASLVATNFLGQNTPEIAVTEALYSQMWAQNAEAMYRYASNSAAACRLTPFTAPALDFTNALAPASCGGGASVTTNTPPTVAADSRLLCAVPAALNQLASPAVSSSGSDLSTSNSIDNEAGSGSGSDYSALSSMACRVISAVPGGVAGERLRLKGRPVSVRAWFGGTRAGWTGRRGVPARRNQAHTHMGPTAMVGKLLVPQSWHVTARTERFQTASEATKFILPCEVLAVMGWR
ncbi:PPE family protein [Mycobacterium intracellulare]|uniref:PPE family protein n=1 Tax=Mycobacterium intracellulare TaxID=1767 RepID=UPI000C7C6611|nr:PPE family protein [Mycobacterium intracellulare]